VHGVRLRDPYHGLRDREDPEVLAWLRKENEYAERMLARTGSSREDLFREMKERIRETDTSVPWRRGPWLRYTRTEEGREYAIHCRRRDVEGAPEEILIDENELARDLAYFALGDLDTSPDHRLLAWSTDTTGDESYTLFVRDLATGRLLLEGITGTSGSLEWANDSRTLYYVVLDEARRPHRVFRHRLGSGGPDELLFEESDDRFWVSVAKTRSDAFVLVETGSETTTETHAIDASDPGAAPRVLAPREPGVEYAVDHHGDRFFVVTNAAGATNFRLVEAPAGDPGRAAWRERIPHRADVYLEGADAFERHLVLSERADGQTRIRVIELATGAEHTIEFPETVYTAGLGVNPGFSTSTLRLVYSSMVTPHSVYDYDMDRREPVLRKRIEVLGGYDPAAYETRRSFATSTDGTRVPISIVARRDLPPGPRPAVLYGYGAYGSAVEPSFRTARISLLDRGIVFAIAHVRGGCEMGRPWYDHGKLAHKENSFSDFLACAETLIREGTTAPDRLAAMGGSAGGLLVATSIQRRPELFRAALLVVPFVDIVNTMLDPSLPLTVIEYEEWGNPSKREDFERLLAYSPYDNLRPGRYPDLLVTAGLEDRRVHYWEPAKYVAKLRQMADPQTRVLLRTNLDAGHGGASGRYAALREIAFEYAFLIDALGATTS